MFSGGKSIPFGYILSNSNLKLGHSLPEDSGNATKFKGGAGSKKKSGFWNCCSGGSTGSGYPSKLIFFYQFIQLHICNSC